MLFTSLEFLILLIITFLIYYIPTLKKIQVQILIVSSFVFYAYNTPILLLLLFFSIAVNSVTSYLICFKDLKYQKIIATIGVVINLAVLCFFKYTPLFANTFLSNGDNIERFLISIPLPIGISFFTFEGITLLVDTYNNNVSERRKKILIAKDP